MKSFFFALFLLLFVHPLWSQVEGVSIAATNAPPDPSAMLDVQSNNKGVLIPEVTLTALNIAAPVLNPATGLMIFNPDIGLGQTVPQGFYYWNGTEWEPLGGDGLWTQTGAMVHRNLPVGMKGSDPSRYLVEFPAMDAIYTARENGTMVLRTITSLDWGAYKRYMVVGADGNEINALNESPDPSFEPMLFLQYNNGFDVRIGGWDPLKESNLIVQGDIYGKSWASNSDARLKRAIKPIESGLNLLLQCRGVQFEWKSDTSGRKHYGVIAQELEKVLPELVNMDASAASKEPRTRRESFKNVAYLEIIPVLIEAVKEQQRQIETQKTHENNLENIVKNQEKQISELTKRLDAIEKALRNPNKN